MHLVTCKAFDIVVVPFPFVDKSTSKNRPALVISSEAFNKNGNTILMMITSSVHASWPNDTPISRLTSCGLTKPSKIRAKLFTIDNRLIKSNIGTLDKVDRSTFLNNFYLLFKEMMHCS